MAQCLMLDVDGVLITGRPHDGRHWSSDIQHDLGIDPNDLNENFFVPYWQDIVVGRRMMREVLAQCLPRFAPTVSVDQFISYWFEMDSRIDQDVLAQSDDLRARGVSVFLATNQEHCRARYLMKQLSLSKHFDGIIYSADVSAKKPDAGFFEAAAERSGFAPKDLLLVDDTLANVKAALREGWRAKHWTGTESLHNFF
jgi:putative hydrolase of the HAD superfamily